ncbi:MAG: hypothetical protein PHF37_01240 [Phycisphaerae bacterium]|nr:hypothetical protein [Phycisphaerae bacterium]
MDVKGNRMPLIEHGPIGGEVELVAEKQTDEVGASNNLRKSETTVFEERLRLNTTGSVYHPNFLLFNAGIGIGLTQQRLDSDEESGRVSDTLDEYNFFGQLLRTKKYPINFYTSKSEDIIPRHFLGSLQSETENSGASLSVRSEDWPMTFGYSESKTTQNSLSQRARDFFTRDDKRLSYSVSHYFSELSHMSFQAERNNFSQQRFGGSTDTQKDRYTFLHDLIFGDKEQYRLDTFASYLKQTGSFNLETQQLEERFRIKHLENFSTRYEFGYLESIQDISTTTETRGLAGFEHRLYESLFTTGDIFTSKTEIGSESEINQQGGTLGFNYQKKNPWGTLFATYTTTLTETEQSGGSGIGTVINERHFFRVTDPTPIELDRRDIDASTIVVWDSVRTTVFLENIDYRVTEINGRVQISIITGGDIFLSGDQTLSFDYDFILEPERTEERLYQTFTLRERFTNGFSLYYSHRRQDEKIKSNFSNIVPDEYRVNTFGADYYKGGLGLLAEYSKEDSTQSPSTSKRLEASYNWLVNQDTRATVYASNHWLDFGEPDPRDITFFDAGGELSSRLTDTYSISTRLDYRNENDSSFGKTTGLHFIPELQYRYRQLSFELGMEIDFLKRRDTENNTTFLYFRLRRIF